MLVLSKCGDKASELCARNTIARAATKVPTPKLPGMKPTAYRVRMHTERGRHLGYRQRRLFWVHPGRLFVTPPRSS
jgi:hypothetical protein